MAGVMHYMSSQKKAGQTGKAFWARDSLCRVSKIEIDKCLRLGIGGEVFSNRVKVPDQEVKIRIKEDMF